MGSLGFWLIVALAAVIWACAVLVIAEAIGSCARTRDRLDAEALAQQAADFGEPSRADVEAEYGPLVLYGPTGETYDGLPGGAA